MSFCTNKKYKYQKNIKSLRSRSMQIIKYHWLERHVRGSTSCTSVYFQILFSHLHVSTFSTSEYVPSHSLYEYFEKCDLRKVHPIRWKCFAINSGLSFLYLVSLTLTPSSPLFLPNQPLTLLIATQLPSHPWWN